MISNVAVQVYTPKSNESMVPLFHILGSVSSVSVLHNRLRCIDVSSLKVWKILQ